MFWSTVCDWLLSSRPLRQSPCWASPHALGCNHKVIAMAVVGIGLVGFIFVTAVLERGGWKSLQSLPLGKIKAEELSCSYEKETRELQLFK